MFSECSDLHALRSAWDVIDLPWGHTLRLAAAACSGCLAVVSQANVRLGQFRSSSPLQTSDVRLQNDWHGYKLLWLIIIAGSRRVPATIAMVSCSLYFRSTGIALHPLCGYFPNIALFLQCLEGLETNWRGVFQLDTAAVDVVLQLLPQAVKHWRSQQKDFMSMYSDVQCAQCTCSFLNSMGIGFLVLHSPTIAQRYGFCSSLDALELAEIDWVSNL